MHLITDPHGGRLTRRAIQLGLRGDALKSYCGPWIVSIEDVSDFVRGQHRALKEQGLDTLITPTEQVYPVEDQQMRKQLGMDLS